MTEVEVVSGESNAGAYSPLHSEPSLRHSISQNGHHEDSLDLAQPASNAAPSVQTPFMGSSARGNSRFTLPRVTPSPGALSQAGNGQGTPTWTSDMERSPRASDQAPLPSEKSWNRRVQARSEELRRQFNLPPTEVLMDDFVCALRKKVLLQGRLFVFDRHLCFYSSLFGYHKLKVIPLERTLSIAKKKNVGFPNSIQVEWCNDEGVMKKEFFTSFLSREDAYKLIIGLWEQCSEHARARVKAEVLSEEEGSRVTAHRVEVPDVEGGSAGEGSDHDGNGHDANMMSPFAAVGTQRGLSGYLREEPSMVLPQRSSVIPGAGIPEFEELPSCEDPTRLAQEFTSATEAAPELPSNMQHVMTCTLPTSPRGFFRAFICSSSHFFPDFHSAQGHSNIKISPWQRHFQVGPVRDLRFVTPLKGWRIGPPQALCHQTQRFRVYKGEHLVFETSQAMSDIPYGDHFKVETRWDVTPSPSKPGHCDVTIHIAVPFTKNTMWKKFIEKGVTDSSLEAYQMFKELADQQLADMQEIPGAAELLGETPPAAGPSTAATIPPPTTTPGHRRTASRPSSPEELLPASHEEWEALLGQVAPKWRGGLRALRRAQASGGAGTSGGVRHRRRQSASRSMDWGPESGGPLFSAASGGLDAAMKLPLVPEGSALVAPDSRPQGKGRLGSWKLFAANKWPILLLCLLCSVIICFQGLLLWMQFHRLRPSAGDQFAHVGPGAQAAALKEASAIIAQMEALQRDAQAWRRQLDLVTRAASELAQNAQRVQRSLGGNAVGR